MNMAHRVVLPLSMLVCPAAFSAETYLEAPGPQGPLKATFMAPDAGGGRGSPTVLIVPGSGPTDRDGNNPLGVKASTYRLLAEALARSGIGTVRIDKRGMFASGGAIPDANDVTLSDYANDVHAWVDVIKKATGVPCVWALGHSEGGLVALAAAQKPDGLCGLILVATPGRPSGDVLRAQLRARPENAPLWADAEKAISTLERGGHVDVSSMHPALQSLFAPSVQGFLISVMRLDPAAALKAYGGPALLLQGDQDLQVQVDDVQRLGRSQPSARVVVLPNVNHVLKRVAGGTRHANLAAYADPSLPIAPGVVGAIAEFVHGAERRP